MSTIRTTGSIDPPQTTTQIVCVKRIRTKVQLAADTATLTADKIIACLPLTNAEFRIMKFSVWGSAGANSFIQVLFPSRAIDGDDSTWADEGTQGSIRPQVHLTPNFRCRENWILTSSTQVVATFQGTATDLLVVDITLQYRTVSQSCPAFWFQQPTLTE